MEILISFQFNILNVNDNPPVIDKNGLENQLLIKENQTKIESHLTLTAQDADELGELTFDILDKDSEGFPFNLTKNSLNNYSLLIDQSLLDYEQRIFWSVSIIVQDPKDELFGNQFKDIFTVYVNVDDISDTPPRWLKQQASTELVEESGEVIVKTYRVTN